MEYFSTIKNAMLQLHIWIKFFFCQEMKAMVLPTALFVCKTVFSVKYGGVMMF